MTSRICFNKRFVYHVCNIGKLEDAQSVLKEAIATLEKSATAHQEFCQVSITIEKCRTLGASEPIPAFGIIVLVQVVNFFLVKGHPVHKVQLCPTLDITDRQTYTFFSLNSYKWGSLRSPNIVPIILD